MDKPIICYQRRSKCIIRDDSEGDKQLQQIVSPCIGRKRTRMGEIKNVTLPEDILYNEIVSRLPLKFILRCRRVCKSWNSRFSTSDFVNSHLTHQLQDKQEDDDDLIITKCFAVDEGISILSHTNEFPVRSVPCVCDTILGSINGLILMCSTRGRRFCLWNPAVGQVKFFCMPPPRYHPTKDECEHFVGGFCWDRVQNDYKVLMFCYESTRTPPSQLCIYSFNSATWTRLCIPQHPKLRGPIANPNLMVHPSTIVKGTPYWSYSENRTYPGKRHERKFFCTFKFVPEIKEFRFLPDFHTRSSDESNFVVNADDRVVRMSYEKIRGEETLVKIYSLDNDDSGTWSKMYTIGPMSLALGCWPSHCYKNGGEILIYKHRGPFSLYDPKTKETKEFDGSISTVNANRIRMYYSYTPSLICVRGMESMQNLSIKNGSETYSFVKSISPRFTRD
ncbi:putative F-box/kelch-repeat protein At3g17280 isoform X2 [Apium graveolens]